MDIIEKINELLAANKAGDNQKFDLVVKQIENYCDAYNDGYQAAMIDIWCKKDIEPDSDIKDFAKKWLQKNDLREQSKDVSME